MTQISRFTLMLCFLMVLENNAMAQGDFSIMDFRYPETRALDWTGMLDGRWSSFDSEHWFESGPAPRTESGGEFGINSEVLFFHSRENHDHDVWMRASGNYSSSQTEWNSESYSANQNAKVWNMALDGAWRYGHYFNNDDGLHIVGNTEGSHRVYKTRYELYENEVYRNLGRLSAHLEGELALGIGFGRMRDGTFVFQALRVVERLRESSLALADLTRDQFLALVNRLARRREYMTNFQRHEKYIVQDIVDDLVKTGVLDSSAISSLATIRVEEGLRERVAPRFFGWRTYATFGAKYSRTFSESKEMDVVDYHRFTDDGVFLGTFVGEWGHAISMFSHLNASVRLDVPNKAPSTHYRTETMVSMSYEITERIDILAAYSFSRRVSTSSQFRPEENNYERNLSHSIQGTLRLFIEDMISFDVNAGYVNFRTDSYHRDSRPSSFYRRSGFSGSFRINYNII